MPEKKKITKKVISKAPVKEIEVSEQAEEQKADASREAGSPREAGRIKRVCFFDQSKTEPSYTDINTLRRFVTDRAKIVPKLRSNLCSKHQRAVTRQIKYARHLALLPFTPKV